MLRLVAAATRMRTSVRSQMAPCSSAAVSGARVEEEESLYGRVELETSGSDRRVLQSYQTFVLEAAKGLGVEVSRTWKPTRIHSRKTVLKSAFVHKKHRVQYETQSHFRCFELRHLTGSTLDTFLEYTQRNLPEGVAMVVTKEKREPFPDHILQNIADLASLLQPSLHTPSHIPSASLPSSSEQSHHSRESEGTEK